MGFARMESQNASTRGSSWTGSGGMTDGLRSSVLEEPTLRMLPLPVRWTAAGIAALMNGQPMIVASTTLIHANVWGNDPTASPSDVEEHLLLLDESGWLTLEQDPLDPHITLLTMTHQPPAPRLDAQEPPHETRSQATHKHSMERGREGERASESASEGGAGRRWDPMYPDPAAPTFNPPPLGCAEHPNNTQQVRCQACAIARSQRDEYIRIYREEFGRPIGPL